MKNHARCIGIGVRVGALVAAIVGSAGAQDRSASLQQDQVKSSAVRLHPNVDPGDRPWVLDDGSIEWRGRRFDSFAAYFAARDPGDFRCGALPGDPAELPAGGVAGAGFPSDCDASGTDPTIEYDPDGTTYCIRVVFHVLRNDAGTVGDVSNEDLWRQINILNEDFNATPFSNGDDGTFTNVRFSLAAVYRYNDSDGLNDVGDYWTGRAIDPHRYLNIYTNSASGYLGYANIPQSPSLGAVGSVSDRVVLNWEHVGTGAFPYDLGRTGTHEVGHYLGLLHTFQDGCDDAGCLVSGDLICDTPSEASAHYGCTQTETCGTLDPIHNYMNYTDDFCMEEFSPQQARRSRCTIQHWRPLLASSDACDPICGEFAAGSPFEANGTPSCADAECCVAVCEEDPYCCAVNWDALCAGSAFTVCGQCGDADAGSAFVPNGSPGCTDADCCEAVCVVDSYCCLSSWDSICVGEALEICAGCGDPESGSPWESNGSTGCADAECCALVCAIDPYCCETTWDAICAEEATVECAGCGTTEAGSCFVAHVSGATGCDDSDCCAAVCSVDPYCCENTWDGICAGEAVNACPGWCEGDFDFDGDVDGADLGLMAAVWGTSAALADLNDDGLVDGADFGLFLGGWGSCDY
jgi:hypothetical protein